MPNFHQLLSTNSNAEINRILRKYENQISRRKFAGDWVLASYVDMETAFNRVSFYADQLEEMWTNTQNSNTEAGFISQRLTPQGEQLAQHDDCLVFRRLRNPLPCISLTDTGALRGYMRRCHNAMCDDKSHVTEENIEFLSQITDTVWRVVENLSEGNCKIERTDEKVATTTALPEVSTTSPVEMCDQPILQGSTGGSINTTTTTTATCRITSLSLELCNTRVSGPWAHLNGKSAWRPKKGRKSSNLQHW
uniref:Uncharacterized protein LOC100177071 n=1 Tax=Phallusia mammillata TaxID=59560 RepID=A0A6F9DFW8_9ASCI|nr:uncharacterized protein LOC100177071 [Phallusia mammillata]